jgi:hypothetical protein
MLLHASVRFPPFMTHSDHFLVVWHIHDGNFPHHNVCRHWQCHSAAKVRDEFAPSRPEA